MIATPFFELQMPPPVAPEQKEHSDADKEAEEVENDKDSKEK